MKRRWLIAVAVVIVLLAAPFVLVRLTERPSNGRAWTVSQSVLPRVTVRGDLVDIRNIRDFRYRSDTDFDVRYAGRTYDLRKLESVDYVVSRFGSAPGLAHSFLTFGFEGEYVAISVEARKEIDESYSPLRGLLRQYELMYVIGTERDVIGLRTSIWNEQVSLYPVRVDREVMRRVFLDMVHRAEAIAERPEFYDTVTNSCSSNIVRHVNAIRPDTVPFGWRTILPGFSAGLAQELGLIESRPPSGDAAGAFLIAGPVPLDDAFSKRIR